MVDIETATLKEAIDRAEAGKTSGEWDLFRGQSNVNWDVTSSAGRLSADERQLALEQFKRFAGWASIQSEMQDYFKQPDALWAIAQHYGLKTNFIDFTDDPQVAAFFALDTDMPANGDMACIVCVNVREFNDIWDEYAQRLRLAKEHTPEFVRIDVRNLWRLQLQRGCFLWSCFDIEHHYAFTRISFPRTQEAKASIPRGLIYPTHQSPLEQRLSEFFMEERMLEGQAILQTQPDAITVYELAAPEYEGKTWLPANFAVTADWNDAVNWSASQDEHASSVLPSFEMEINLCQAFEDVAEDLLKQVGCALTAQTRKRTLDVVSALSGPISKNLSRLTHCASRLWNGMRSLPYRDEDILCALKETSTLCCLEQQGGSVRNAFGDDTIYIEMGGALDGNGAYSRGAVTASKVYSALNPEFLLAANARLSEPIFTDLDRLKAILLLPGRPWEKFSFAGLTSLMVEQIIPSQLAWRARQADQSRVAIYFSPTDFKVFGIA